MVVMAVMAVKEVKEVKILKGDVGFAVTCFTIIVSVTGFLQQNLKIFSGGRFHFRISSQTSLCLNSLSDQFIYFLSK